MKTFLKQLFWICLFLIPFTATKNLLNLGELKTDVSAQLLVLSTILFLTGSVFKSHLRIITENTYTPLYLFAFWCLLSFLVNYQEVSSNFFKGRGGTNKFILQFFVLITFSIPVIHFLTSIIEQSNLIKALRKARKLILYCFIFVVFFSLIEIGHGLFHIPFCGVLYDTISTLIIKGTSQKWTLGRISGVTQEPPFLAMYLTFCSPWLFSYILSSNNIYRSLPTVGVLILTFFSGSRTAFLIIIIELFLFFYFSLDFHAFKSKIFQTIVYFSIIGGVLLIAFGPIIIEKTSEKISTIFAFEKDESEHKISNVSRFGNQRAAIEIFKNAPLFGVGFGQQGYHFPKYYTQYDITNSYEIRDYIDTNNTKWPPGFSMFTRLLAETGIIGCFLFFYFNLNLIFELNQIRKSITKTELRLFVIIILTALYGFTINYLQFDSFRLIGYWYTIAFSLIVIKQLKINCDKHSLTNPSL